MKISKKKINLLKKYEVSFCSKWSIKTKNCTIFRTNKLLSWSYYSIANFLKIHISIGESIHIFFYVESLYWLSMKYYFSQPLFDSQKWVLCHMTLEGKKGAVNGEKIGWFKPWGSVCFVRALLTWIRPMLPLTVSPCC